MSKGNALISAHIDMNELHRNMESMKKAYGTRTVNNEIRKTGKILQESAQAKAPVSDKPHTRTWKGKTYTYMPGNLRRSIQVLSRGRYGIFVGPKIDKKAAASIYSGSTVDGYYAHMVEYGVTRFMSNGTLVRVSAKPYMRPAFEQSKGRMLADLMSRMEKLFYKA